MPIPTATTQSVFDDLMAIRKQLQSQQQLDAQNAATAEYAAGLEHQIVRDAQAKAQAQAQPQVAATADVASVEQKPVYGEEEYNVKRQKIDKGYEYGLRKMAAMGVNEQDYKTGKDFLEAHYGPKMKPFEESDQYKNAQLVARENVTTTQANMLSNLNKTISSVEKIEPPKGTPEEKYDQEKRRLQSSQIKTFLTQLVNSAKGSADAEQANEFLRRSPELVNLPEFQALMGKGLLNASGVLSFMSNQEGDTLKQKLASALSSNPEAYLKKAKMIHDDLAGTYNDRMTNQVIVPTSPKIAEKHFGIKLFPKFEQATQQQAPTDVVVTRPAQEANAPIFSRDQIMAEIERRKALKAQQQPAAAPIQTAQPVSDFTGRQGF